MDDENREGASIFEAVSSGEGPYRSPEEESPYDQAKQALRALKEDFGALSGALHSVNARPEEATAAAVMIQEIGRAAKEARTMLTDAVLLWFAENAGGIQSLKAGPELKFWPSRSPGPPKVGDHVKMARDLWPRYHGDRIMRAVNGDETAYEEVSEAFVDFVASTISKSGFKAGKVREIMGHEFWEHYTRPDVDSLKDGPTVKLGIGNTRFMKEHRKGVKTHSGTDAEIA